MSSRPGINKGCFSLLLLLVSSTQINTWCAVWTFACLLSALVHESIQKGFDQTPKAFGCSKPTLRIPCQSQSQTLHPISKSGVINFNCGNRHTMRAKKQGRGCKMNSGQRCEWWGGVHACYGAEQTWAEGEPVLARLTAAASVQAVLHVCDSPAL